MGSLNIMIGIPGSGKTTLANKIKKDNTIYLSSDEIRVELYGKEVQNKNAEVFDLMQRRAIESLKKGLDVIYDATNLSLKKRKNIINRAKKYGKVRAYLCCPPISVILERNIIRQERNIPWEKLLLMLHSIECPMYYEGFDEIFLYNPFPNETKQEIQRLYKYAENFEQGNPFHQETLGEHLSLTGEKMANILSYNDTNSYIDGILLFVASFHDIGKLYTRNYNDKKGYYTYYNHQNVSCYLACSSIAVFNGRLCDKNGCASLEDDDYLSIMLIQHHMDSIRGVSDDKIRSLLGDKAFLYLRLVNIADNEGRIGIS